MLRFRAEEPAGGEPETPTPETPAAPETPAYTGPTQEEWQAAQEAIEQMTGTAATVKQIAEFLSQPQGGGEENDLSDLDIDAYVEHVVNQRLAPIMPVVNTAAQRAGEERMKSIFAEEKKTVGDFDETLAERAAHYFFAQTGDPAGSVKEAAKYAAELRKAERAAAVADYKKSLQRGPHDQDPGVEGGGNKSIPAAKTYDEVIERYAGTDDL